MFINNRNETGYIIKQAKEQVGGPIKRTPRLIETNTNAPFFVARIFHYAIDRYCVGQPRSRHG